MRKQKYTQDNNTIHKTPTTISSSYLYLYYKQYNIWSEYSYVLPVPVAARSKA